jgi:hypothetical protein
MKTHGTLFVVVAWLVAAGVAVACSVRGTVDEAGSAGNPRPTAHVASPR